MLKRRLALDFALRLDHREGLQIGPLLGFMQTRQLIEGITTPRLDPSMILLHGFGHRVGCPVRRRLEPGKEIAQRIGQIRLVVLERQDVMRATIADGLGDVGLGSHGIEGDDAAFQRQGSQELRNGRLFIGLRRRCPSTIYGLLL